MILIFVRCRPAVISQRAATPWVRRKFPSHQRKGCASTGEHQPRAVIVFQRCSRVISMISLAMVSASCDKAAQRDHQRSERG